MTTNLPISLLLAFAIAGHVSEACFSSSKSSESQAVQPQRIVQEPNLAAKLAEKGPLDEEESTSFLTPSNYVKTVSGGSPKNSLKEAEFLEDDICGTSRYDDDGGNITAFGLETLPNEFPWMVRIEIARNRRRFFKVCEGVIISENAVLTVRECTGPKSDITLHFGDHDSSQMEEGEVVRGVREIVFQDEETGGEFAILFLNELLSFSKNIRPICLPATCADSCGHDIGREAIVSWFGNETLGIRRIELNFGVEECQDYEACGQVSRADDCEKVPSGASAICTADGERFQLLAMSYSAGKCGQVGAYGKVCDAVDWIASTVEESTYYYKNILQKYNSKL